MLGTNGSDLLSHAEDCEEDVYGIWDLSERINPPLYEAYIRFQLEGKRSGPKGN